VGGKAAAFAATADERWGDFAKTEPYTPFCHELLLYLSGRTAGRLRSVPVGSQVPIPFEASPWPTLVHVTPPGASEAERLLPGTTPDRYSWWKTDVPGYYRLDFERKDKRWRGGFAVNTAPIESRMEKVPFDKVQRAVRAGKVELVGDGLPGGAAGAQAAGLGELTPYLALLGLLLLVAEGFLANRFYGVPKGPLPEGGDEGGQAAGGG